MISRRPLVGVAIGLAALFAAVAADRLDPPARPTTLAAAEPSGDPTMAPAGATSAAWYCPGGPLAALDSADVTVNLANTTARPLDARLTALPVSGSRDPVSRTVQVPALGSTTVRLAEMLDDSGPAGASVVGPGGLVAQQSIKTPEGAAVGPCASAASDRWYTAVGSTAAGSSLLLPLLNPFPDDAIVGLSFSTNEGRAVPGDLQGLVVPGRSLLVVDVGDHVRRRDAVSTEVVARRGRLVVGRNFRKGTGSSTALASPSASPTWYLPGGVRAEGVANRLVVANPSDQDAEVSVELRLAEGAIEPFTLAVPALDRAELNLDDTRVPRGVPYAIAARSLEDVPIVAERSTDSRAGRSDVLGGRVPDRAWVAVASGPRGQDALAIYNAGEGQAEVTVTPLDGEGVPLSGGPLRIEPGVRASLRLDDKPSGKGAAVLVESNQVLIVERNSGEGGAPTQGGAVAAALGRR
jgi:hypothetical protein